MQRSSIAIRWDRLLCLWLGWVLAGGLLLGAGGWLMDHWRNPGDFIGIFKWTNIRREDLQHIGMLILWWSPLGVTLAGVHFVEREARGSAPEDELADRRTYSRVMLWSAPVVLVLAVMAGVSFSHYRKRCEIVRDLWAPHSGVFEQHANAGEYKRMVEALEETCIRFNRAKRQWPGEFDHEFQFHSCNHGFSYLFCNYYDSWDSTTRLAPYGVLAFLEHARFDGSHPSPLGGYGPWQPIAEEVSRSRVPILRAMGCALRDDMDGYVKAAYLLASRDEDALPMAAYAAINDPDPVSGLRRMAGYEAAGIYLKMEPGFVKDLDEVFVKKITQALDVNLLDESMKMRLRGHPWTAKLDAAHRRMLGIEEGPAIDRGTTGTP